MKMLTLSIYMMMILTALFLVTIKLSKKKKLSQEKNKPFECGFMKMSSARNTFSIHFFMMAMLFLIFDIEISLILPMMMTKMINLKQWMLLSTITIMILITGLIHEWKNNMLEWSN